MEDEELIDKMREAVMTEKQIAWAGKSAEYQAVNDACLKSLANMVQKHFIEQACDAASDYLEANTEIDSIYLTGVEQAIRDRFKGEKFSE